MGEARSALLIGIGRYDNGEDLKSLDGPRVDVQNMRAVLTDPAVGAYRVETLEDVDSSTACAHLEDFLRDRSENETCLLYFSGHGFIDARGALYLCTTNASFRRPKTSTIPAEFISGLIDDCQSKRVVLVLDCCYSGNYEGTAKSVDIVQPQLCGTGFGRVVLTAGAENQLAWDNGDKGSLFSRHIAEGIRSGAADTDGDGRITVQELYDYVYRKVVTERPSQRPGKTTYRESGPSFLVAESPVKRIEQIPAWLHHELSSSVAETRLNALKGLEELNLTRPNTRPLILERLRAALEDDSVRVQRAAREILSRLEAGSAPPAQVPAATAEPGTEYKPESRPEYKPQPRPEYKPEPRIESFADRETGTPESPARAVPVEFSLTVDLVLWAIWAAFGTLFGFVLPIANHFVVAEDAEFLLCANVFLIVYASFIAVRYRLVPDVPALVRTYSWWIGSVALVIADVILWNFVRTYDKPVYLFAAFVAFNLVGLVSMSMVALRLRIPAAIGVGLLISLVWVFGYLIWPHEFSSYDSARVIPAWVVTPVVVFTLGALARSRYLKTHGR